MTRLLSLRPKILILAFAFLLAGGISSLYYVGARVAHAQALDSAAGSGSAAEVAIVPTPHGAVTVTAPSAPAVTVQPLSEPAVVMWFALAAGILFALDRLLGALSALIHAIATRTKNKWDDSVDDAVRSLRGDVRSVMTHVGLDPDNPPAATSGAAQFAAKPPQSGFVRLPLLAALAIAGILGLGVATGGCSATTRQDTIKAALITTDAARDGLLAYDVAHQHEIVSAATSLEDGKAKLASYRATRDRLVAGMDAAYRALVVAALANDKVSLENAQAAVAQIWAAVQSVITATGGK